MAKTEPVEKHIHKLKRVKYKTGSATFFCTLDCPYRISPPLALGKRSICWRCEQPFIMNEYSLRLAKPHCESCHHPKGNGEPKEEHTLRSGIDGTSAGMSDMFLSLAERLAKITTHKQAEPAEVVEDDGDI